MPGSLLPPWTPGGPPNVSTRPEPALCRNAAGWLCLCLLLCLLIPAPARGGVSSPLPRQQLTVSLRPADHTVRGVSRITIPAGQPARLFWGDLHLTALSLAGQPLEPSELAGNTLSLAPADRKREVALRFWKRFPARPGSGTSDLVAPSGVTLAGFWHPRLDRPALFQLTATLPPHFEAVCQAEEISSSMTGGRKTVRFRFDHPLAGLVLVAGPYQVRKIPFGADQTLYTYFFTEDQGLAQRYEAKALGYLQRYQRLIGPFPYRRFSVVENRLPTGLAVPTFTLLGQAVVRLPFITDTSLGHEVLHQWFGNAIEVAGSDGNWAEGITTYLADQTYAQERGQGSAYRKKQLVRYQSYVHKENSIPLTAFRGGHSSLEAGQQARRAVGYDKASMVFHMLRRRLGDPVFFAGLREFYQRKRYQPASWQDIRKSFEAVSDRNLGDFFHQWLNRTDVPILTVQDAKVSDQQGLPLLSFTLTQKQDVPYALRLPLVVHTPFETVRRTIEITDRKTPVRLSLASRPTRLVLDPDYDLMRRLAAGELPPTWSRFLGAKKRLAVAPVDPEKRKRFQPLVALLQAMNCPILPEDQVNDRKLAEASVLFLGADLRAARSLFASPRQRKRGVVVDIREHPLAPGRVAIRLSASSADELARVVHKLRHYGPYSYLFFEGGRLQEKRIAATDQGQVYQLAEPPAGLAVKDLSSLPAVLRQLAGSRVVYLGEIHTSEHDHQVQAAMIRGLHRQSPKLAIGMEMFPRAVQPILDAYVNDEMGEWEFLKKSHYFQNWGYDYRYYRPIIDFARRHRLPVVALNLGKETVRKVFRQGGVSALPAAEQRNLPADRDLGVPGYRQRLQRAFGLHNDQGKDPRHFNGFLQAQALWDETMAASVARFLHEHPDYRMAVVAGQGHTNKSSGIPPRVARRLPEVRQTVVTGGRDHAPDPAATDLLVFLDTEPLPPKPLLGVQLANTKAGVQIAGLSPHGQAGKQGIRKGDLLLAIDHEPVARIEDVKIVMLYKKKGETVQVRIRRPHRLFGDQILTFSVPL